MLWKFSLKYQKELSVDWRCVPVFDPGHGGAKPGAFRHVIDPDS